MKKVALVLISATLLALLASMCAQATVTQITSPDGLINPGWNLIALPAIPKNPDANVIFGNWPDMSGSLLRWEASTQSLIQFSSFDASDFKGMLLGDGYWVSAPTTPPAISFEGITDNDTVDMWISLPGVANDSVEGGWTLIGTPYDHSFPFENVKVTDGTVTVPIREACEAPKEWIERDHYYWNSQTQSLQRVSFEDRFPDSINLDPWTGYWFQSKKDNIALILEVAP